MHTQRLPRRLNIKQNKTYYKRNTRSCAETHSGRYGSPAPSSISILLHFTLLPRMHRFVARRTATSILLHIAQHFTVRLVPNCSYFFSQMTYKCLCLKTQSPISCHNKWCKRCITGAYPGFQRGGCLRLGPIRKVGGGGGGSSLQVRYEKWGGGGGCSPLTTGGGGGVQSAYDGGGGGGSPLTTGGGGGGAVAYDGGGGGQSAYDGGWGGVQSLTTEGGSPLTTGGGAVRLRRRGGGGVQSLTTGGGGAVRLRRGGGGGQSAYDGGGGGGDSPLLAHRKYVIVNNTWFC